MVRGAGHVVVGRDEAPELVLVCVDAPVAGWDPFAAPIAVPFIASTIADDADVPGEPLATLPRPFGQSVLAGTLDHAEAILRRSPMEAAAQEIADSLDVFAALDEPAARAEAVLTVLRSHLGEG